MSPAVPLPFVCRTGGHAWSSSESIRTSGLTPRARSSRAPIGYWPRCRSRPRWPAIDGCCAGRPGSRQRRWAVENARGLGAHLAQWLAARGERVDDVPCTATARVRELSRGGRRKNDVIDAPRRPAWPRWPGTPPRSWSRTPQRCSRCWMSGAPTWPRIAPGWSTSCTRCCAS